MLCLVKINHGETMFSKPKTIFENQSISMKILKLTIDEKLQINGL